MALLGHTLPNLFRAAVESDPDGVAFADGRRSWSWQEWWEAAEALARGLQERGVTAGEVVVAQVPNSHDFLVLHSAVAAIGAVLLPVHGNNGPRELVTLVRRSQARVVVVPAEQVTPELAESAAVVLVTGSHRREPHSAVRDLIEEFADARARPVRVRPDDPFLLLPSSATTSLRPKISMHSHDGLLSNAAAVVVTGSPRRTDSIISASPFSHLFGLLSVHVSLFARTTQLLLSAWDSERLISLARAAVDSVVLFAVPTQLHDLLARLDDVDAQKSIRLREVRTGGSKVSSALVEGLRRRCAASVVVQWGMSELGAGLFTSAHDPDEVATRSIGRPVPGARVRVVREDVDCVPGDVGELWVASPYAFRGYLGDAELSASTLPADGWLRTGDLASVDADGLVAFHGRIAELIDVGGQKFSSIEVEELLADLPGIGHAAVVGRPDPRLGEYPCLVVTEGATVTLRAVTEHLVTKGMARYKMPVAIVVLPAIPRTATGKIARRRLADLVADFAAQQPGRSVGPADSASLLELVMAGARTVIAELSGDAAPTEVRADLMQHATFRDHGMTSLGAVRLAHELGEATGLALTSTAIFDHPTPAALAAYLAGAHDLVDAATPKIDFAAEVRLADDIIPAAEVVAAVAEPDHLLLTGATGFVGAFLLRDLVRDTGAVVHCLVRGATERDALARLRANLAYYRLAVDPTQIQIVLGDLAQPRLGLTEERFDDLARRLDGVYHAGGEVHWLRPYQELRAANVSGTEEILRLAARHRTVPVHHISTIGVFGAADAGEAPLRPADPTGPPEALDSGYRQSKWVAEKVIDIARSRGLPVSMYRVDAVCGDQVNGACQTRDFVWLSVRGMVQARSAPRDLGGAFRMVPADYVSGVVTALSRNEAGGTFHVQNDTALSFATLVRQLRSFGYQIEDLDAGDWAERVRADLDNVLSPLLDTFQAITAPDAGELPPLDTSATLAAGGIPCPAITSELVETYVKFFMRTGFLPESNTAPTAAVVAERARHRWR